MACRSDFVIVIFRDFDLFNGAAHVINLVRARLVVLDNFICGPLLLLTIGQWWWLWNFQHLAQDG